MVVTWYNPCGGEQTKEQWADAGSTTIGLRVSRDHDNEEGWDDVLILFNPHDGPVPFILPEVEGGWTVVLTTADPKVTNDEFKEIEYVLTERSLVLMRSGAHR
jgi:glycogen operon protein